MRCASSASTSAASSLPWGASQVKGPGLVIIIPIIQQAVRVDLRTVVLEVPTQDVISRDNVSVKVSAVVYLRVIDPQKAIIQVVDYLNATSQLAQTMLRSVLGKHIFPLPMDLLTPFWKRRDWPKAEKRPPAGIQASALNQTRRVSPTMMSTPAPAKLARSAAVACPCAEAMAAWMAAMESNSSTATRYAPCLPAMPITSPLVTS